MVVAVAAVRPESILSYTVRIIIGVIGLAMLRIRWLMRWWFYVAIGILLLGLSTRREADSWSDVILFRAGLSFLS